MAVDLSYAEFEILQFLVRCGDQSQIDLPSALSMLDETEIETAVKMLTQRGIVQPTQSGLTAVQPLSELLDILEPYRVKRAVILAAGLGSRLRPATNSLPKPMVMVHEKRLIETQLDALMSAGITDVTIVRGYKGEEFDLLLADYPDIKFIDSPLWNLTGAIVSAELAIDLLTDAYLIEGDLFIKNPQVIRPYEYHSSYCGVPGSVAQDWYFLADSKRLISGHAYGSINGDSQDSHSSVYKFVGIMYWTSDDAKRLKTDLRTILQDPTQHHRFIESIPSDPQATSYDIFVRRLQ